MTTTILRILLVWISATAFAAQAIPIVFINPQYDTFALAQADAPVVVDSDGPTGTPPVQSDATSGLNDLATAFAFADSGLLVTLTEVLSFVGPGTALAQSHFNGSFAGSGRVSLNIGFDNLNSSVGDGTPEGHLFILLTNSLGFISGAIIPPDITAPGDYNFSFLAPVGGINTLDVVLFSSANTTGAGQSAQNFASVTINGTIPLPATSLLVVAGLAGMFATRRRAQEFNGNSRKRRTCGS